MGHLAPGETFENIMQLKHLVYILKEFWIENGYFHIEIMISAIMISATEMLEGLGTCSRKHFKIINAIWCVLMYYFDQIRIKKNTLFIIK